MDRKNRITGLFYWKPFWIAYQQEVGVQPKVYLRLFWAENYDAVHLVYISWGQGHDVELRKAPLPLSPIKINRRGFDPGDSSV